VTTDGPPFVSYEQRMAAALGTFGWEPTLDFWRAYYTDTWTHQLAHAVLSLVEHLEQIKAQQGQQH
jgi:hypothetical protein